MLLSLQCGLRKASFHEVGAPSVPLADLRALGGTSPVTVGPVATAHQDLTAHACPFMYTGMIVPVC